MEIKISYIIVYRAPHQKPASHHETLEVDDGLTIRQLVEFVRKKCLEYCQHHGYELERFSLKDIG
ncbi:hypothetical protein HGA34_05870 [Candidatus Falkowbacteria bacterium]|nr:hypothetical protein [Candidatus Falkowbacteria bacterium]